jgi:hypothetical protein
MWLPNYELEKSHGLTISVAALRARYSQVIVACSAVCERLFAGG